MTDSSNFNQHSTARCVQQRKRIRVALLETAQFKLPDEGYKRMKITTPCMLLPRVNLDLTMLLNMYKLG
jgi:hypothetical protein